MLNSFNFCLSGKLQKSRLILIHSDQKSVMPCILYKRRRRGKRGRGWIEEAKGKEKDRKEEEREEHCYSFPKVENDFRLCRENSLGFHIRPEPTYL